MFRQIKKNWLKSTLFPSSILGCDFNQIDLFFLYSSLKRYVCLHDFILHSGKYVFFAFAAEHQHVNIKTTKNSGEYLTVESRKFSRLEYFLSCDKPFFKRHWTFFFVQLGWTGTGKESHFCCELIPSHTLSENLIRYTIFSPSKWWGIMPSIGGSVLRQR